MSHAGCRGVVPGVFALALLLLTPVPVRSEESGPPDGQLQVRAFTIHHRGLAEAAEAVSTVLSAGGSVKLQPRARTLVVEDLPEVLERARMLLLGFDLPPRNIELTLTLVLGTDRREPGRPSGATDSRGISREVRGVHESLGDFTKWTSYELLGSQSVTALEGHSVTVRLSDEYRVVFRVETVRAPTAGAPEGTISLRGCTLLRVLRNESGEERFEELLSTALELTSGKLLTLGAARGPEARKALFLTIKARPV